MKTKKTPIFIALLVLLAVIAMFVIMYYSYYTKVNHEEEVNVTVKKFDMLLTFETGKQINGYNMKPGWTDSMVFSVKNYSSDTIGKYKIVFESITPLSNMIDEDFVYEIVGKSDNKDVSNKVINTSALPVPIITKDLGSAVITPNTTHTYTITYKIKDNANINKYPNGNIFSSSIKIINDEN